MFFYLWIGSSITYFIAVLLILLSSQVNLDLSHRSEQPHNLSSMSTAHPVSTMYELHHNNHLVGYLIGSIHAHFNPVNMESLKKTIEPIVEQSGTIHLEADLPHHSMMQLGIERIVLELIDGKKDYQKLESATFQQGMLRGSMWFGTRIVMLPWTQYSFVHQYPKLALVLSSFIEPGIKVINILYNSFTRQAHTRALQDFALDQQRIFTDLFTAYLKNNALQLPTEDSIRYFMRDRDRAFAQKILTAIKQKEASNPDLFVVGSAHLPALVEHLETAGITLKAQNLIN